MTCALQQLVTTPTRTQLVNGVVLQSTIDHAYTNCAAKVTAPEVLPVGDSDHMGVVLQMLTRQEPERPQSIRLRSYKQTDIQALLEDLLHGQVNDLVTSCLDLNEAAEIFNREVVYFLNKHAPKPEPRQDSSWDKITMFALRS